MTMVRIGDTWQGWRTAYSPTQPRDEQGRWTDGGSSGDTEGKSLQDYARSVGVLGKNAASDFDYHVGRARKSLGDKFDGVFQSGGMKSILDEAAKGAATDGEFESLEKLYIHFRLKSPWSDD